jgi:uncharacterized membrane protein (DUF2068 family)
MSSDRTHPRGLMLIAAFKLLKGLALFAVGIAVQILARQDALEAQTWADLLRIDPHNHYLHRLLERIPDIDAHKLHALSIGTFIYSALFFTEGIGLFLRKRWAEILTIVATAGLIPLEVYEIFHHPTLLKVLVLLVNVAVVAYLVFEVRRLSHLNR